MNEALKKKQNEPDDQEEYKKLKTVLDSNTACAAGEIPSDIIVDPTFGSFSGGVQDFEHGIGNAEGDLNIGAG